MKHLLKLILLLASLNLGAQETEDAADFLTGLIVSNATEVTTATKIPVLDANLKMNTWITAANLLDDLVSGSGTVNYLAKFTASGTVGNSQVYDNGTNVGIGTTTPNEKFTVALPSNSGGVLFYGGSQPDRGLKLSVGSEGFDNSFWYLNQTAQNSGSAIAFGTRNTEAMRIDSKRNVGIGTTTPNALLEGVNTDPTKDFFRLSSSDATSGDILTVEKSTGNVGIGIVTPTRTLHVNGNALIDELYISGSEINTYNGGNIDFGAKREADGTSANSTLPNFRFAPTGTGTKGRVSIGAPALGTIDASLHVVVGGNTSIVDAIILEAKGNSGAGRGIGILFRQPNSSPLTIDAARISASDGGLQLHTGAAGVLTEKVRVTDDGELAVGTTTPNASAKLQVESTTQGFLPPRMTSAQKNAISSPAEGLMIYQTDSHKGWYGFDGTNWVKL